MQYKHHIISKYICTPNKSNNNNKTKNKAKRNFPVKF